MKIGDVQTAQGKLADGVDQSSGPGCAMPSGVSPKAATPTTRGWRRDLSVSLEKIGDVQIAQGNLTTALTGYQASPRNPEAPQNRFQATPAGSATSRSRTTSIGDVQIAQGNLATALTSFPAASQSRSVSAKADPDNAGWQRDLSVFEIRDRQRCRTAQGNLAGGA